MKVCGVFRISEAVDHLGFRDVRDKASKELHLSPTTILVRFSRFRPLVTLAISAMP